MAESRWAMMRALRAAVWAEWIFCGALALAALWPTRLPAWAKPYFSPPRVARAALFSRGEYLAWSAGVALQLLALTWAVGRLRRWPAVPAKARWSAAVAAAAVVGLSLLLLPLDALSGWWWPHRFGLSTASLAAWLGDRAKGTAIAALLAAILAAAAHGAIRLLPRIWWLLAGLLAAGLMAASVLLGPLVIDPLFFRFTPLPAGPLRQSIASLAQKAGVPEAGLEVYVMNASSRTTAPNAYVAGLLGTTRIVLYDTLLRDTPQREVLLVVAHELGHWRLHHVPEGLALGAAGALAGAAALGRLLAAAVRSGAVSQATDPRAMLLLFLGVAVLQVASLPLQNTVSRTFERQADRFALQITGDRAGVVAMQVRLASRGLVDVSPPAFIQWTLYDHPSPLERVAAALQGTAQKAHGANGFR